MKTILHFLKKEFLQLRRNKQMLPIILGMPVIQLLILSYAATFEIKIVSLHVIDKDHSHSSALLISKFSNSKYFNLVNTSQSDDVGLKDIASRKAKMVLIIPEFFEKELINGNSPKIQSMINAEDGSAAAIIQGYASAIAMTFGQEINLDFHISKPVSPPKMINIIPSFWYNQELDYKEYMVPGILVVLVTIIGMFLASMNVVREKEIGTIEQLNVTPIHKYEFIIGKLLPFWLIALFELAFGLGIAKLFFDLTIRGNIFLIFGLASIYLLVILAYGLFISTFTDTMQQAMFIAWFFAIIFILMSGLFTPIDSMPKWAQYVTIINPVAHFIEIMRRVILKGSGFAEVQGKVAILSVYALVMITLSVWRYRKVSD